MPIARRALAAAAATSVIAASACGAHVTAVRSSVLHGDVPRSHPAGRAPVAATARGLRLVGSELVDDPGIAGGGNRLLSPASLATVFAMVRAGARGDTRGQIDRTFHFPRRGTASAFNALTQRWNTTSREPGAPAVLSADAVFAAHGLAVRPAFLDALSADFGADLHEADLGRQSGVDALNEWVRDHTGGEIGGLLGAPDPSLVMFLVNALYLRAYWSSPFDPSRTHDRPFTLAGGRTVSRSTMYQLSHLRIARGPGWTAVDLPYDGPDLAMWVLLPDTVHGSPAPLLDSAVLHQARARARDRPVRLFLPAWRESATMNLIPPLRRLGLIAPFAHADFSGISAIPLRVSEVVQKATIDVTENGTTASAATGIGLAESAMSGRGVASVRVDHPFAFEITQGPSAVPLFEGVVDDPSS